MNDRERLEGIDPCGVERASVLDRAFYDRAPEFVARELLGRHLIRRSREGVVRGRIVETEAYLFRDDPACHAARGRTPSNGAMFGPPGHAYVYPIHSRYCFNVVTERRGIGSAVLVRAVEPLAGVALMQRRRRRDDIRDLARGPARLCEAFAIDRRLDHHNVTVPRQLWMADPRDGIPEGEQIGCSPRIGVTSGHRLLLRYFVLNNPFVSGTRRHQRRFTHEES